MTSMKYRIDRRTALGLIGGSAASLLIPVPGARVNAQTLDKVSYQTNWRAQAEHGGFYLAVANGIYKKYGIDADIRMGGPQQNPSQLLLGGRVDMIMSNSFEGINYAKEGLPFLVIAAIFQKDPQVIISHPGVGNDTLEPTLKGKPILIGAGGRTSYWPFLQGAASASPTSRSAPTPSTWRRSSPTSSISQQGFLSSEPFVIMQAGVQPGRAPHRRRRLRQLQHHDQHLRRRWSTEKKDVVQRFVNATAEGWAEYMKGGPAIEAANALIKKDNPDMDRRQDRLCAQGHERAGHRDVRRRAQARRRRDDRRALEALLRDDDGGRRFHAGHRLQEGLQPRIREQGRRQA